MLLWGTSGQNFRRWRSARRSWKRSNYQSTAPLRSSKAARHEGLLPAGARYHSLSLICVSLLTNIVGVSLNRYNEDLARRTLDRQWRDVRDISLSLTNQYFWFSVQWGNSLEIFGSVLEEVSYTDCHSAYRCRRRDKMYQSSQYSHILTWQKVFW